MPPGASNLNVRLDCYKYIKIGLSFLGHKILGPNHRNQQVIKNLFYLN